MLTKISLKWSLITLVVIGILFCLFVILFSPTDIAWQSKIGTVQKLITSQLILKVDLPAANPISDVDVSSTTRLLSIRIRIPKINIDAAIESVGLTVDGSMDVPKDPGNAAWFNPGPLPGEIGSAVIDGHYGKWKSGESSVFDDLDKLTQGDIIEIFDKNGIITSFVVSGIQRYNPDANAADIFGSNDGKAHLNLITCDGVWDDVSKGYSQRLVIFSDKE